MKKITTTLIILIIFLLTGCETIDSVRFEKPIKQPSPETFRTTDSGPVIGIEGKENVHMWLGIPFAEPPLDSLRWKAPRQKALWEDVRKVIDFSQPCVQFQSSITGDGLAKPGEITGSEDCLYLNIYAPPLRINSIPQDEKRLPVMVWIHGGGNTSGMTSEYNPEVLVKSQNVIVVSIAYRLGLFGWLSHPEIRNNSEGLDKSANFGLLDQIQALKWIKQNIKYFGGNPNNITIFGESAGGQNVIALYVSPLAKGLFQRAISQSGGIGLTNINDAERIDRNIYPLGSHYKYRHKTTEEWVSSLRQLGLINTYLYETNNLKDLRSLTTEELLKIWDKKQFLYEDRQMPRIIGDGIVLPADSILDSLKDINKHANVPIILGVNKDENKTFNLFDEEMVTNILNLTFIVKDPFYYDLKSDYQSLAWRSNAVDAPADAILDSGYDQVYTYRFDWDEEPKIIGMDFSFMLGAGHGMEIPFVMGDFEMGRETRFLFTKKNEEQRLILSEAMMNYWTQFARSGSPNGEITENLPFWKKWPAGGKNQDRIMILDTKKSNGPRMSNGYVPKDKLVSIFDSDPRSSKVTDKCLFLNDVYSWVGNWKELNNSCKDGIR